MTAHFYNNECLNDAFSVLLSCFFSVLCLQSVFSVLLVRAMYAYTCEFLMFLLNFRRNDAWSESKPGQFLDMLCHIRIPLGVHGRIVPKGFIPIVCRKRLLLDSSI